MNSSAKRSNPTANNNNESKVYSVLNLLDMKNETIESALPLDLSVKSTKSLNEMPASISRNANCSLDKEGGGQTFFENNGEPWNRMQSMIDMFMSVGARSPRRDHFMQALYPNMCKAYDDYLRKKEVVSSGQNSNFNPFNNVQMKSECLPSNLCSMPDHIPINKDIFFYPLMQQVSARKYVTDLYNQSRCKLFAKDYTTKVPHSISVISEPDDGQLKSTSPISLSNKRRKRTKVTDSRLMKRSSMNNPTDEDTITETLIENTTSSPSQSSTSDDINNDPKKYTLTPIHLRKAKLMFLYTRYPNSQMLKSYFPDIIFYKQNTAQLVKWFSNFREFYYSEMEKAVQRALSTGIKYSSELYISEDCELFKNLMTHFNKNRQIEVPKEFLLCVQITLREFFDAISVGKNLHQSWKKPIYKNIAKLDQPLPDFFKDFNWMLELAKDDSSSGGNQN